MKNIEYLGDAHMTFSYIKVKAQSLALQLSADVQETVVAALQSVCCLEKFHSHE